MTNIVCVDIPLKLIQPSFASPLMDVVTAAHHAPQIGVDAVVTFLVKPDFAVCF